MVAQKDMGNYKGETMRLHIIHIIYIMLIFSMIAHADDPITIPAGTCLTDNSSNISYCSPNSTILNTGDSGSYTLWANASQSFNNGSLNISCLGNLSITVVNNTTIQSCPATSATLIANSSGVFNNATISCITNQTQIIQQGCPAISAYIVANSTEIINNVTINCVSNDAYSIPDNYCFQNVSENLSGLQYYQDAVTNVSIVCLGSPIGYSQGECPTGEYCQFPQPACPAAPTCPAITGCSDGQYCQNPPTPSDCNQQLAIAQQTEQSACNSQIAAAQANISACNYQMAGQATLASGYQNLTTVASSSAKTEVDNQTWWVWLLPLGAGIVLLIGIFALLYRMYFENTRSRRSSTTQAFSKAQLDAMATAGNENNVWKK